MYILNIKCHFRKHVNTLHSSFVPQSECVSDYGSVGISLADSQLCVVSEVRKREKNKKYIITRTSGRSAPIVLVPGFDQ